MEADAIAVCLSGAITAPGSLTDRVLADLAEIRSSYRADLEQITLGDERGSFYQGIRFAPPWLPGCVLVKLDPGTSQLVVNGQYHAWDELNRQCRLSEISLKLINMNWLVLNFKGQLHPRRLAELYKTLPGVLNAQPNFTGAGSSWIYPSWRAGSQLTYLFRHGWGDCPAGCFYNEFWYFISNESSAIVFAGYWNTEKDPVTPDWWADASPNIKQYRLF